MRRTVAALIALLLPAVAAAQPSPTFTTLHVNGAASLLGGGTHTGTFTGGTFSGITLSGTIPGTPTFSGNYTVSGNPTFSGSPIFSGTLKIGAGGSGVANIVQQGTGTFGIALGSTTSLLNIKNSGGTSILQLGGSPNLIKAEVPLTLSPPGVWSGTLANNAMLYHSSAWSGTTDNLLATQALMFIDVTSDTIDASASGGMQLLNLALNTGAGVKGNRFAAQFIMNYTALSGDGPGGSTYNSLNTKAIGAANAHGTALVPGSTGGSIFGLSPVVTLTSAATFWTALVGMELDTQAQAGSSMLNKIGIQIVQAPDDVVAGVQDDVALSFNNHPGAVGWTTLVGVGRFGGANPLSAAGWIVQVIPPLGVGTIAAGGGLDFNLFTPTTAFMRGNNFQLDPSGNWTANSYKVGSNQVVGARITGWGAATNGAKTAFNGSTATLAQTSAAVAQVIADLTTHGLIGP